jgi:transposase
VDCSRYHRHALWIPGVSCQVFIFRGRRGDLIKILWATDDGVWLLAKRLTNGRFIWPQADGGKIHLTSAQLSMVLEGIDWRQPRRTAALSMV